MFILLLIRSCHSPMHTPDPSCSLSLKEICIPCLMLCSAQANKKTLIVPDKDADGLSSGSILRRTLILLGLAQEQIETHLLSKGNTIHSEEERRAMAAYAPAYIFVLDQGSRPGPPVIDGDHCALVIDREFLLLIIDSAPDTDPSPYDRRSSCFFRQLPARCISCHCL